MSVSVNGKVCVPVGANKFMFWVDGVHDITLKSCSVSYTNKTVDIAFYQFVDKKGVLCVERFLQRVRDQGESLIVSLSLTDDSGKILYTDEFKGLTLFEHEAAFDYDDKTLAVSKVIVGYEKKRRLRGKGPAA